MVWSIAIIKRVPSSFIGSDEHHPNRFALYAWNNSMYQLQVLYCFSNFRDLARGSDSFVSTICAVNHVQYFPQLGDIGRIDGHTAELVGEAEKMCNANFDDANFNKGKREPRHVIFMEYLRHSSRYNFK